MIYSTNGFKKEFESLKKKNSYSSIEKEIIDFLSNHSLDQIAKKSTLLVQISKDKAFVKVRIDGSGGYRLYVLLYVQFDEIYLSYIHPKKGSMGKENIGGNFEKSLIKELATVDKDDLWIVRSENQKLLFEKKPQ